MQSNYSLKVKKIFKNAEVIAKELKHSYVGTEHLLLSLIKNDDNIRSILLKYDLTYEDFFNELNMLVNKNNIEYSNKIYTPLLKKVIKLSEELSKGKLDNPMYLLQALLELGDGLAVRIMINMDIEVDLLFDEIKKKEKGKNVGLELYKIGRDLTNIDSGDILVGRDKELDLIIETLLRKNKNNPLLIGDAGVGKSAIIEELARKIKQGSVPNKLKSKKIISLEMSALVAGTKYRGEFEEKLNKIIKEIENNPDIILFIDEMHTMANAGGAEGAINASDILKPYLARGIVKVIGATTTGEYNKYIAKDKALARRFEIIKIKEPSLKETEYILSKIKPSFEKHYNIKITDDNIKSIVTLTDKYILNRYNPDKSIDLLDSVCSMKEVVYEKEKDTSLLENKLKSIVLKKESMVKKNNFDEALKYKMEEVKILRKIKSDTKKANKISENDIKKVLLRKENIPLIDFDYKALKMHLLSVIIGQKDAINSILDTLYKKDNLSPVSMLLSGSTGVGKTKTVKEIASFLSIPLIRLDLSEYNESISVSKLIGASAGYVGYDDETIFDKVKMNPCSIILLDEIEKAHPNVINLFLQILDEGIITSSKGEKIDFKNTIIFLTSNTKASSNIGFFKEKSNFNDSFSKEFLGRITSKISYKDIDEDALKEYLKKHNIKDKTIIKDFDYKNQGFRGLDRFIKEKKVVR